MIADPESIAEVFSILHDGRITRFVLQDGSLLLDVAIQYLAERVEPTYRRFSVQLQSVRDVSFAPWPNDPQTPAALMTDVEVIFRPELDILDGEAVDGKIQIFCNQASPKYGYCGGELWFCAAAVEVADEAGKTYSLDELRSLAAGYWDDFSKGRT